MAEASLETLLKRLQSPDRDVRIQAIEAMGAFQPEDVLEPLTRALRDPEPRVRRQAVLALGGLNDYRALAPLTRAMKDPDPSVREAITQTFRRLGEAEKEATPFPDSPGAWAGLILDGMESRSPSGEPHLQGKEAFEGWAYWALRELEEPEPLDAETAMAGLEEWDEGAEEDIAQTQAWRTLKRLIADLTSPHDWTRMAAAATLEAWKAPQVTEALEEASHGEDEEVRALARSILEKREADSRSSASPQIRLSFQGATELRAGQRGVIRVAASNKGEAKALDVELTLDNSLTRQSTRIGTLVPGQTRASEIEVLPSKEGTRVPFTLTARYRDEEGKEGQVVSYAFFAVLPGDPPAEESEPFRVCPYCGKSLNLPKTPRFCPYCGEGLVS